jgi:hypothetical protein
MQCDQLQVLPNASHPVPAPRMARHHSVSARCSPPACLPARASAATLCACPKPLAGQRPSSCPQAGAQRHPVMQRDLASRPKWNGTALCRRRHDMRVGHLQLHPVQGALGGQLFVRAPILSPLQRSSQGLLPVFDRGKALQSLVWGTSRRPACRAPVLACPGVDCRPQGWPVSISRVQKGHLRPPAALQALPTSTASAANTRYDCCAAGPGALQQRRVRGAATATLLAPAAAEASSRHAASARRPFACLSSGVCTLGTGPLPHAQHLTCFSYCTLQSTAGCRGTGRHPHSPLADSRVVCQPCEAGSMVKYGHYLESISRDAPLCWQGMFIRQAAGPSTSCFRQAHAAPVPPTPPSLLLPLSGHPSCSC